MNKHLFRLLFTLDLLVTASFASGCAHVVEVLNATANELQRQQDEAAYYAYYAPRPASDTSARGIK